MKVDRSKCIHCGACVGTCPQNTIFLDETRIHFNKNCTNCALCVKVCPMGAIYEV